MSLNQRKPIPFSRVDCGGNELKYVSNVIERGWLTTGKEALELERKFCEITGAGYACAVNSCTSALHLALEALGIEGGDHVLVPTMTFTATAEIVRYLKATPIFCDMEAGSCLMTAADVETHLDSDPKIRCVIFVHFGGQTANIAEIFKVCSDRNVHLVEDSAHAFPSRMDGKHSGTFGIIGCYSFYANKTMTTGEGGMLVTDSPSVYERVKLMRLHGINRDAWDRFTSSKWEYDIAAPGFKYNMPDLNAAVGLAQLERIEPMRMARQRCFEVYLEQLKDVSGIDLPLLKGPLVDHSCHLFWIVLRPDARVNRQQFIDAMNLAGIGTSVHYKPLHVTKFWQAFIPANQQFPQADRHWAGCVSLPVYSLLSQDDLMYVVATIREILK